MSLTDIIKKPMRRLNPYRGLLIDVPTWTAAHDYHRIHQQLHSMSMHSPGIVAGLEVVAWNPPDNSVVIYPGVAVDSEGRVIIVGEPQRFYLQTKEKGTAYIVLQYREVPQEYTPTPGEQDPQPLYTLEAHRLEERRQLPEDEPYVELARVEIAGRSNTISDARDPYQPGANEIDLRFREVSGSRPLGEVAVGLVPLEAGADGLVRHQAGALALCRAINATTGYRARFRGTVDLRQEVRGCHLILMTGQEEFTLAEEWERNLKAFHERGGVIFGEACGAGITSTEQAVAFRQSFRALAERLGAKLTTVERGHPLFTVHHVFAEVPGGVDGPALIVSGEGIIYSDGDYGCLWDGGRPEKPAPREAIRSAVELGTNLGVYSHQRVHRQSVRMVAG